MRLWNRRGERSRNERRRQQRGDNSEVVRCSLPPPGPRIFSVATQIIRKAQETGVVKFAVNGVSEQHPCVIPCFWPPSLVFLEVTKLLSVMKEFFSAVPGAAVGEIGLDKGSHGKKIDFMDQVQVFRQQLKLAKELERPVSVHCVRAFGDLLEILQSEGPFPAGLILHSYLGSAEMVPGFAKHGAYFSFSGYLTSMKPQKAKKMLKMVPTDRILLESDAPDGLPQLKGCSLSCVPGDASIPQEQPVHSGTTNIDSKGTLNHPANISTVLGYVATLLEMPEDELAQVSYRNAMHLFSYPGSKISEEAALL
ncbi:unnamed protein product [Spirodela intermedia]|uniref:Uncharacterized protein n=1 Tax=Spirodela intermedia TaxID=51605 RepID=A0A7I8IF88_SPIIN|nr:unnamed protein product [Spirodela intermedia]CAA6656470.1 unnamed protein product [Spirodela intermedia]